MLTITVTKNGQPVAVLTSSEDRMFESGSDGFYAGGKVVIDGKRYQVSMPFTRIGSKDENIASGRFTPKQKAA